MAYSAMQHSFSSAHPLTTRPDSRRSDCAGGQLPRNRALPLIYRLLEDLAEAPPKGERVRDAKTSLIEALLLIADQPLPVRRLVQAAGLKNAAEAREVVRRLQQWYDLDGTAFQVEELAGGFQLLTRPEYHRWLVRLRSGGDELRLSPAAKETLAIVAYRQPIMRAEVEQIRGVHCGETLRLLMEKGVVRIAGRHDSLGRPSLYGTTKKFLQVFGLKSVKDLPELEELQMPPANSSKDAKDASGSRASKSGQ